MSRETPRKWLVWLFDLRAFDLSIATSVTKSISAGQHAFPYHAHSIPSEILAGMHLLKRADLRSSLCTRGSSHHDMSAGRDKTLTLTSRQCKDGRYDKHLRVIGQGIPCRSCISSAYFSMGKFVLASGPARLMAALSKAVAANCSVS